MNSGAFYYRNPSRLIQPLSVNEVLWEHNHTCVFTYCSLWQLLWWHIRNESLWLRLFDLQRAKYLLSNPLKKSVPTSGIETYHIQGLPWWFWWLRLHASAAGGAGSIPGWGTKIPCAMQHDQKTRKLTLHSLGFEQEKPSPWAIKGPNGRNCLSGQWPSPALAWAPPGMSWMSNPDPLNRVTSHTSWVVDGEHSCPWWLKSWGEACPPVRLIQQVSSHDSGVERERVSQNNIESNEEAASLSLRCCGSAGRRRLPCCRAEWKQAGDAGWNLGW